MAIAILTQLVPTHTEILNALLWTCLVLGIVQVLFWVSRGVSFVIDLVLGVKALHQEEPQERRRLNAIITGRVIH